MLKTSILATLLALLFIFNGCSSEDSQDPNDMIAGNEYVLTGLNNAQYVVKKEANSFILDNAKGKVVIFDIFATWCPPCKASASHLTSLQEKYKDDLVIIGLTVEDEITNAQLLEFRKDYKADYILVNSSQNRPLINQIASVLNVGERFPIPLMAMYKDGLLINHYVGAIQEEFVESDIKKALGR